jgi:hypothetical protein
VSRYSDITPVLHFGTQHTFERFPRPVCRDVRRGKATTALLERVTCQKCRALIERHPVLARSPHGGTE